MKNFFKNVKKVLNIFFIIWIFINIIIIVKGIVYPNKVPSFLGYKPYIVISGSNQTGVEQADFVIAKNTRNLNPNDVVVVQTEKRIATTYSIVSINNEILKLENETGTFVNLSKASIEGKVIIDLKFWGGIFYICRNPIVIFVLLVLSILLGMCIYKIKVLI